MKKVFLIFQFQDIARVCALRIIIVRICLHNNLQEFQSDNYKYQKIMSLKIVVLAKQVPDTRNVGPDAMTPAP